jgi:acyl carrier protein
MNDLVNELRDLVIQTLDLEDIEPDDIDAEAPLFGDGLGLDSIDALELGVALHKRYDLKIDPEAEDISKWFYSINSLSAFVMAGRKK